MLAISTFTFVGKATAIFHPSLVVNNRIIVVVWQMGFP
jgi:hypothetical protein